MKGRLYKNGFISLVIINFWTLYGFFDYFTDQHGSFMEGFGVLLFYFNSLIFSIGIGVLTLLLRVTLFRKQPEKLKANFFYVFAGIFNLNLFIIWIISLVLKVLEVDQGDLVLFTISTFIIALLIFADVFEIKTKLKFLQSSKAVL